MKILLVLLAFMTAAHADGLSYLGICNKTWDCERSLNAWKGKRTIITGWLETTFGIECPCVKKVLASRKAKIVRVHLLNGPCMRNKRCGRSEPFYGLTVAGANRRILKDNKRFLAKFDVVIQRLKQRLVSAKGVVQCYVSPCLECDLNGNARKKLLNRVSAVLPNCVLVDNPLLQRCIQGTVCEKHGDRPLVSEPCIVDLDGTDGRLVNRKKWLAAYDHCELRFYWEPWMNCIGKTFIDPTLRICKIP